MSDSLVAIGVLYNNNNLKFRRYVTYSATAKSPTASSDEHSGIGTRRDNTITRPALNRRWLRQHTVKDDTIASCGAESGWRWRFTPATKTHLVKDFDILLVKYTWIISHIYSENPLLTSNRSRTYNPWGKIIFLHFNISVVGLFLARFNIFSR